LIPIEGEIPEPPAGGEAKRVRKASGLLQGRKCGGTEAGPTNLPAGNYGWEIILLLIPIRQITLNLAPRPVSVLK